MTQNLLATQLTQDFCEIYQYAILLLHLYITCIQFVFSSDLLFPSLVRAVSLLPHPKKHSSSDPYQSTRTTSICLSSTESRCMIKCDPIVLRGYFIVQDMIWLNTTSKTEVWCLRKHFGELPGTYLPAAKLAYSSRLNLFTHPSPKGLND